MKILIIILIILLIGGGIYIGVKYAQIKKITKMPSDEMFIAATRKKGIYISVARIENGEITYQTYGRNGTLIDRTDYQYEIGSISKTMAALLVAQAIEEGKLKLTDSIDIYLDLPKGKYYPSIERILTHTSGYKNYYFESEMLSNHPRGRNDFYLISKEKIRNRAASVNLQDKDYPFVYSNFGISLLGLVLEEIYQTDYTELLSAHLQNHIGMNNTTVASCEGNLSKYWDWGKGDGYIPAGAVISDIKDMATYLNYYMTAGDSYAQMPFQPLKQINANNSFNVSMGIRCDEIGMTWIHDTEQHLYWHNGGTSHYNSHIAINEDFTKGIVLLSNYGPTENFPVTVIGAKMMSE